MWASGLRNPQQFSWDGARMVIIDIGQSQLEEVNAGVSGANYGWPSREGSFARGGANDPNVYDTPARPAGMTDPIAQFDHEEIRRDGRFALAAVSGAFSYTGSLVPELSGMTIVSELVSGRLFYFDPRTATADVPATLLELGLSFGGADTSMARLAGNPYIGGRVDLRLGRDATGEVYLLGKGSGDVYRLAALNPVPEPATWLLTIAGVGLVGGTLRRGRGKALRPFQAA